MHENFKSCDHRLLLLDRVLMVENIIGFPKYFSSLSVLIVCEELVYLSVIMIEMHPLYRCYTHTHTLVLSEQTLLALSDRESNCVPDVFHSA